VKIHHSPGPAETPTLGPGALRDQFLIAGLFRPGEVVAHYTDLDRMIIGGAVPDGAPLALPGARETGTDYFLERREIGILNLGAPGAVRVGGARHDLGTLDCLYVGLGEKEVSLDSGPGGLAQFYFVSAPAHRKLPTAVVRRADLRSDPIGDPARANVWNTMPPHTHSRRTEIYLYFDLGEQIVVHLMGEPTATRHLIVRDREAVLSPSWSIHCGAGTGPYRFVWAMAGDNQVFDDMDAVALEDLR